MPGVKEIKGGVERPRLRRRMIEAFGCSEGGGYGFLSRRLGEDWTGSPGHLGVNAIIRRLLSGEMQEPGGAEGRSVRRDVNYL